jgi:hypothetical protein
VNYKCSTWIDSGQRWSAGRVAGVGAEGEREGMEPSDSRVGGTSRIVSRGCCRIQKRISMVSWCSRLAASHFACASTICARSRSTVRRGILQETFRIGSGRRSTWRALFSREWRRGAGSGPERSSGVTDFFILAEEGATCSHIASYWTFLRGLLRRAFSRCTRATILHAYAPTTFGKERSRRIRRTWRGRGARGIEVSGARRRS